MRRSAHSTPHSPTLPFAHSRWRTVAQLVGTTVLLLLLAPPGRARVAPAVPVVEKVEFQPLQAQAKRIAEALDFLGAPLSAAEKRALQAATTARAIQEVLDPHCL